MPRVGEVTYRAETPQTSAKRREGEPLKPFWQTTDGETVRLYLGNVTEVLARLPEKSVHCCITSPPYWALRSYLDKDHKDKGQEIGSEELPDCKTDGQAQCGRCFVCSMVAVFWGVRRVLRDDGTLYLNLGDSYARGGQLQLIPARVAIALQADGWILRSDIPWVKRSPMPESIKNRPAKSLEYIFMFAKKMGYYWDYEAVRRVSQTKWHGVDGWREGNLDNSYKPKRHFNQESETSERNFWQADLWFDSVDKPHGLTGIGDELVGLDVTSESYEGAHYATFPRKLVEPFLKAGTSAHGCCAECGAPWRRVTTKETITRERPNEYVKRQGEEGTGNSCANSVAGVNTRTLRWEPTCECNGKLVKKKVETLTFGDWNNRTAEDGNVAQKVSKDRNGAYAVPEVKERYAVVYESDLSLDEHPIVPCTLLDPFIGSGTSCAVAIDHGRHSIGIDLSEKYLAKNAVTRITSELLKRPATVRLIPRARRTK